MFRRVANMLKKCLSIFFRQPESAENGSNERKRSLNEILSPGKSSCEDGPPKKRVRLTEITSKQDDRVEVDFAPSWRPSRFQHDSDSFIHDSKTEFNSSSWMNPDFDVTIQNPPNPTSSKFTLVDQDQVRKVLPTEDPVSTELEHDALNSVDHTNVFTDKKIVGKILEHLNVTKDILEFRKINRLCKDQADHILKERKAGRLKFIGELGDRSNENLEPNFKEVDLSRMSELIELLRSGSTFPFHHFEFNHINFEERSVQDFFILFGSSILSLKIQFRNETKCAKWNIIRSSLNNVKELIFLNIPNEWSHCSSKCGHKWRDSTIFGKVEVLSVPNSVSGFCAFDENASAILEDMVLCVPNFAAVVKFHSPLPQQENLVSVPTSVSLKFSCHNPKVWDFNVLKYSPWSGTELKELKCLTEDLQLHPQYWKDAAELVSGFLDSSSDDLIAWGMNPLGFLSDIRIPRLRNLKTLNFFFNSPMLLGTDNHGICFHVFPTAVDVCTVFPQLTTVGILLGAISLSRHFPEALYKPTGFETVRDLQCNIVRAKDWNCMLNVFPNIHRLEVTLRLGQLEFFLPWLWSSCSDLEVLKLYVEEDRYRYNHPFLDEVVTGIPEFQCHWLRSNNCHVSPDIAKNLRCAPSVLDMKNLKVIDFIFPSKTSYEEHIRINPFITAVASVYGFGRVVGLKGNYFCRHVASEH